MNEMPNSKPCRKDLLMQIGHASFAVDDVKLYLDTHPRDQEALDFFYEYNKKMEPVVERICKILWTAHSRYRCSFLLRQMELDSGTMAMAGRRVLVYVEL